VSDNRLVNVQNDVDVEEDLPGSYNETCPMPSQDANQVMIVKVEEVLDMQEEAVPVPVPWHAVKAEHEVSCMSVNY
jgi:hypothetical protein